MLDESLLDSPEALARADSQGLLRGAAESGAHVRTAVLLAGEAGLTELRPDGRPRAVLVAGPGPATACAAGLLGAMCNGGVPVTLLRPSGPLAAPRALRWALPGWAGPLDLLLVITPDGDEGGLTVLIEQAYRRGCTVVTVSPAASPAAELTAETHGLAVPLGRGPLGASDEAYRQTDAAGQGAGNSGQADQQRAAAASAAAPDILWSILTPLLVLSDRLGLFPAEPSAVQALADRLDHVAERCGPAIATYSNPAKSLATELSGALPLLWSEGAVAAAVARRAAGTFAAVPGAPALAAELPEAMSAHSALLSGAFAAASDADDFFRDRVEDAESLRARILLLRDQGPYEGSAVVAVRDLAYAQDVPISELEPAEGSSPLEAAAELIATADFTAVYLALAAGAPSWS
ncbi:SIS domain-containing protein [Streptomyces albidus (ex Kaewkla and Franco 2022)]|uniref:SIS domain-containing protein n=1 Tax=Streptomyces albidus (ex Kaewkla and Franco 2022) TaxID=722709 RepID=UPI0015EE40B7|nr:SIS domain-containing protein [Streptomyces albidus (ex Kaewkla and Franco 2022)]